MLLPWLRMETIDYPSLSFLRTGRISQRVCIVSHKARKSPLCRRKWPVVTVSKLLLWSKVLLSGRIKHTMYTTAFPYSFPSLCLGRPASFWFSVEPLSVQTTSSKWALYLGRLLFFLLCQVHQVARSRKWMAFWFLEAQSWAFWLVVRIWSNLPPCPQEQKVFYRLACVYSPDRK